MVVRHAPNRDARLTMHFRIVIAACLAAGAVVTCAKAEESSKPAKLAPLSFGAPPSKGTAKGFGDQTKASAQQSTSDRDKAYARGLMRKYDRNKNRVLEEDEWRRIRGNPEKADTNGDKRITYDELAARISQKRRETDAKDAAKADADAPKSYRLASPGEKLPEGLPGWFKDKDSNGDGQVAMHEYSRRWSDSTASKFVKLDKNDDGVITAGEAAAE